MSIKYQILYHINSGDWLKIKDGPNDMAPTIGLKMCGNEFDVPKLIDSTGNEIYLNFLSDDATDSRDVGYELKIDFGMYYNQYC